MKNRWYGPALVIILLLAVIAAGITGFQRVSAEGRHRSVELVMTYDEINNLARRSGQQPVEVMGMMREKGLTTVLFKEQTLDELRNSGEFTVMNGRQLLTLARLGGPEAEWVKSLSGQGGISASGTYLITSRQESARRVEEQLRAKAGGAQSHSVAPDLYILHTAADEAVLRNLGLGFNKGLFSEAADAGLLAMAQVRNWPGVRPEGLRAVFEPLRGVPNLSAVLFNDDTLPGYPDQLKLLTYEMQEIGVPVAQIEFFAQKGLSRVGVLLDKQVVRLHSIPTEQMVRLTPQQAFDRYMLAATDRNMRALLVYPRMETGDLLQNNLDFVAKIRDGLLDEGLQVGQASVFPPFPLQRTLVLVTGFGVIAGGLMLLHRLGLRRGGVLLGLVSAGAWAGLLYFAPEMGRKMMALAAVVIFPTLSILIHLRQREAPVGRSILLLLRISLFSLLGALFTVGLLSDTGFMLKLDQFAGVKLAHLLPLVLVLGAVFCLMPPGGGCLQRLRELFARPLYVGVAALAGFLLLVALVYLMRTGNEGTMVSSALELRFRTLLENLLLVRPRTKEFLLGHPLMLLLLYTGYRNHWYLPLLFLGIIGQVSLVNTFAHIHTPLVISLIRSFNGLWLGILIGLGLIAAYNLARKWGSRYFYE